MGPAVRFEAADLSVEHRVVRSDRVRDLLGELRPALERVAVPRPQLAAVAADVSPRPEAVQLRLEGEVGMIERLRNPEEPHGGREH